MKRSQRKPRKPNEAYAKKKPVKRNRQGYAVRKANENAQLVGREAGQKLVHYLSEQSEFKSYSVRALKRLIDDGSCRVNGVVERFASYILKRGDLIECTPPKRDRLDHDFHKSQVLFNDLDILAYNKPAGLPVTATGGKTSWCLERMLRKEFGKIFPVHRLDADTSGIVLFARTKDMQRILEQCFRDHKVQKSYLAIVHGHPRKTGERRSYLRCLKQRKGQEIWGSDRGPDAVEALTHWEVVEELGAAGALVHVTPKTGRTHQIRVHFSEMNHPLWGDPVYGERAEPLHLERHMLHANRLQLAAGSQKIDIHAPMPKDMKECTGKIERLRIQYDD